MPHLANEWELAHLPKEIYARGTTLCTNVSSLRSHISLSMNEFWWNFAYFLNLVLRTNWSLFLWKCEELLILRDLVKMANRPFYSCLFGDLQFEWQRGWRWPCLDTDLTAFVMVTVIKLFLSMLSDSSLDIDIDIDSEKINETTRKQMRKAERSVSKQGHLQSYLHS